MLNCLDLPVLHDIEYHTCIAFDSTKRPWLLTLLRKSGGSIQKFTTDPQNLTREDFIDCLRLIPQATILNFELPCFLMFTAGTTPGIVPIVLDKELLYS